MKTIAWQSAVAVWLLAAASGHPCFAAEVTLTIDRVMSPPAWALLERAVLAANADACREFFERYFDSRGCLECVERWGGDDGPDDASETLADWPLLYAMGAPEGILHMYHKAWEGHLRQYTEARTVQVPFARDGMYYKEFPCMFDWQHHNEGLLAFHQQGLSDPYDRRYQQRVVRYAAFYMNEDAGAPNYDPQHRVIRSLFNGSRGPLLRPATALDWAGDEIEVAQRFILRHGERNYAEMLAHFEDYTDIVGDHPLNLLATSLPLHAYLLTGQQKYRDRILEYVDAWYERMAENGNIIPSNVGLDGTIGGACGGKWYGGTYGWGFTVVVPQTGARDHRNRAYWGFTGFMNAFLLTGDDRYLEIWRRQRDTINAQKRIENGRPVYPRMYGDDGWYAYVPEPYGFNDFEIYYLSMRDTDRAALPSNDWLSFLDGKNTDYPELALRADLDQVRRQVVGMREDATTPDTRLSDDPLRFAPARVSALRQLMLGGIDSGKHGSVLHCRLRYFDPVARRPGLPPDVAALVERMSDDEVTVTLVNTNQLEPHEVVVQAGAYAEHEFVDVEMGSSRPAGSRSGDRDPARDGNNARVAVAGSHRAVNASALTVALAPGAGDRLHLRMKRYVNQPTVRFPWDR